MKNKWWVVRLLSGLGGNGLFKGDVYYILGFLGLADYSFEE